MVRFRIDPRKGELQVLGHAGYAEKGSDPVCAGVSTLALTLCRCMEELAAVGAVRILALAAEPGAATERWPSTGRNMWPPAARTAEMGDTGAA